MGGCCCCSSRSAESDSSPAYYYDPRNLQENEPLSMTNRALPVVPSRVLDDNVATSTPGTYQAPPAPFPYNVGLENLPTLPEDVANCGTKADETETLSSQTTGENNHSFVTSDCKNKTDCEQNSPKISEDEVTKPITAPEEEDVCPICLEDYDTENPRIITKCEHHFHLSCILEWMERSDTCAICDQIMAIDNVYGMVSP